MKRTEMLKEIQKAFEQAMGNDEYSGGYSTLALNVLRVIEQAGMLPPYRDVLIEGHQCDENSWEPEDA
jgi:hypothetical protein